MTLAVDNGESWGWDSAGTLGLIGLGIALLVGFVAAERRVSFPMIDLRLFGNVRYVRITLAATVANTVMVLVIFLSTLYLQNVRVITPLEAGLVFLAPAGWIAIGSQLSGRVGGLPPMYVMGAAIAVGALGLIPLALTQAWAPYVLGFALAGLGFGFGWSFASVGTQAVVRPERAGEASGVTLTLVIGIAGLFIAIGTAILEAIQSGGTPQGTAIEDMLLAMALVSVAVAALLGGIGVRVTRRAERDAAR